MTYTGSKKTHRAQLLHHIIGQACNFIIATLTELTHLHRKAANHHQFLKPVVSVNGMRQKQKVKALCTIEQRMVNADQFVCLCPMREQSFLEPL